MNLSKGNFESDIYQTPSSYSCLVCGELSCYRHGVESSINLQPHKGLLIDRTINESLSDLFETILELYVFRWYDEIQEFKKDDERFKSEVRFLFKYLTATLLRRLTSLDLNRIIYYKLIPLLIQHFQTFLQGKRQAKSQQFVEKCVLRCYQQNGLTCKNIRSRNEEIKFIRNLVELTMPYLLPPYTYSTVSKSFLRELFTCCFVHPLVEIATDPLYVNDILMLIFGQYETPEKGENEQTESNLIEILHNYELINRLPEEVAPDEESPSGELLGVEFHKLLKNPQMLIVFFRYLKEEGSINYLQFILSLESFNEKLFDPEISQNEMKELHADATHIYRSYLLPAGSDYLGLQDEQLLVEMKRILDKDYECIVELRSLKPLLEAYEEIYSKLEQFYFPQFLTSDLYIKMIVGSRLFNFLDECSSERFIFNGEENCEELFETNSDEEADEEEDVYVDYGIDLIDIMNADSSSTNEMDLKESETVRDLSTWKISIDKVDTKIQNTFKYYYVFQIKVEVEDSNGDEPTRPDELDEKEFACQPGKSSQQSWIVERKYEEFYVLDGKLKKFHGNALSRIVGLSSKRTLFKQSLAFLESKKLEFEKYLHELTNIPGLKRSELIYNFLKPPSDSTTQQEDIFHHSKLVDINLRKMIKTMPAKFSQERGQNLDSFLKNFINSTESQKGKGNVPNLKDIFNYNNESDSPSSEESPESDPADFKENDGGQAAGKRTEVFKVHAIYDYLIIVLTRICNLKSYSGLVVKLLRLLQPVLNNTIEHIFHLSVRSKVNSLLTRDNLNKSILFLKATILEMESKENEARGLSKLEKMRKQKSQDTLRTLQNYFSNFLPAYLSLLNLNNQTGYFLHSVFQYQLLNKQFFYLFFNLMIEDVFPEIVDKKR